ncbi:MAG: endonuclease III domain-containing protein [Candidatus Bathycorpusculaceae bacterium]
MVKNRAEKVLQTLQETFTMPKWASSGRDPFETLIITIISQNTTDKNTAKAFENLSNQFKITPEALAKSAKNQIEECLKVAGLYRNKAKTIKQVSRIILDKFHGTLRPILSLPFHEARKTLLQFHGVGPKTADVVLLFCAERPTIPVDTHVNRVAKRLGFAPADGDYEIIRNSLQSVYHPKNYSRVHILLISLGRRYCKAKNPLCKECPVNMYCPSKGLWKND